MPSHARGPFKQKGRRELGTRYLLTKGTNDQIVPLSKEKLEPAALVRLPGRLVWSESQTSTSSGLPYWITLRSEFNAMYIAQ
jgi:hypothetical protein